MMKIKIVFIFCILFNSNAFSIDFFGKKLKMKKNKIELHKNIDSQSERSLNSGDSILGIEHGDLLSLDNGKISCLSKRSIQNKLSLDCVENIGSNVAALKKPCLHNNKIYLHGDIIPIHPGVWIYYQGEVIPVEPGKMLVCQNGKLIPVKIPRH